MEDAAGDDNREAGLAEQTEVQCFTGGIKGKKKPEQVCLVSYRDGT